MDFFQAQDQAKSNTTKLIALFALAVIAIVVVTNILLLLALGMMEMSEDLGLPEGSFFGYSWNVFFVIGGIMVAIIVFGSLYKMFSLRGGGAKVAENMNGKLVIASDNDIKKQQLLNVVEEMAIASGLPVPPVYLIDESGINAFAAGHSPSDAVIGITKGALDTLDREELQGVIAHEYSHILHGDMRLNLRLVGVLHGLLAIRLVGEMFLRGNRNSRGRREKGNPIIGLILVTAGMVGWYFGGLIKAAVSRQREFLADAAAVQFTRNPNGIAAALMKINKHSLQSYMLRPEAKEINHSLFEACSRSDMRGATATHPPIHDRIKAILPRWDGKYDLIRDFIGEEQSGMDAWSQQQGNEIDAAPNSEDKSKATKADAFAGGITSVILAEALLNQIGNPAPEHISYADSVLRTIPDKILSAAHEPSGARAVTYLLILSSKPETRAIQHRVLETGADQGVHAEVLRLEDLNFEIKPEQRLPLVSISLSSLRQLSLAQYEKFNQNFQLLIEADKKINLMEWALQKIVFRTLDTNFYSNKRKKIGKRSLKDVKEYMAILLSMLAHSTSHEGLSSGDVFSRGVAKLNIGLVFLEKEAISFKKLDRAIDRLSELKPLQMPLLLKACVETVSADNQIKPIEMELVRAIAAVLDCPMPPLIPQHKPQ